MDEKDNIKISKNKRAVFKLRRFDDLFLTVKLFCEINQIDDYFNMYGYAIHRCKIPNRNVRPHWTYTKTIGCCIVGSLPSDSAKHICDIYNAGITFWKNGSEVGQYQLDNRPA